MITKQQLNEYRVILKNIDRLEEHLGELETRLTKVTKTLSNMPKNKTPKDLTNDLLAEMVDVSNTLNAKLASAYATQNMIEREIEKLSEKEKLLIRLRYIDGMKWEAICVEMNYGWAQIHRMHGLALQILSE